ncbi:hypothetical protein B5808_19015 [Cnuibacter physcomitrellae]|uniref:Uncharacterized protein n=1 Tax=Cnuibacter physcomitrellae TaxID=1619308 RepID=A0A1X9LPD4_9MICO|nr:hypothetical protein B5808_19015 [Cnuibacter physcomitrellae]
MTVSATGAGEWEESKMGFTDPASVRWREMTTEHAVGATRTPGQGPKFTRSHPKLVMDTLPGELQAL